MVKALIGPPFGVTISGIGYSLGEELVPNERIAYIIEQSVRAAKGRELTDEEKTKLLTNPEWILKRTGIDTRYFANPLTATSDLAINAARKALKQSGLDVEDVDFILVATVTPDYHFSPPTAALIQYKLGRMVADNLGLNACFGSDVSSACTSFGAALRLGCAEIVSGESKVGLVIGADKMRITANSNDRAFYVLLGDAAGAIVIEAAPQEKDIFLSKSPRFFSWSDGEKWERIIARVGGSREPLNPENMVEIAANPLQRPDLLSQDGGTVFEEMVELLFSPDSPKETIIGRALEQFGVRLSEIGMIFFHQANLRMLKPVERKLRAAGFCGRIYNTVSRFGNTTSASIPLGMAVAYEERHLLKDDKVLLVAFGGGYTAAVTALQWPL